MEKLPVQQASIGKITAMQQLSEVAVNAKEIASMRQ